ncbi:hypothetical protein CLF_111972 [Clonorchis sinensis]|uniref:Uncharacterized protein n=1 Tax=Clonorchis sinensis TaxID=79923 RepID=G7YM63_CLOSI|nr:hypothetical protein CLF_111972 [Clonorchis sinensis]
MKRNSYAKTVAEDWRKYELEKYAPKVNRLTEHGRLYVISGEKLKLPTGTFDWNSFMQLRRALTTALDREHPDWHLQAMRTLCKDAQPVLDDPVHVKLVQTAHFIKLVQSTHAVDLYKHECQTNADVLMINWIPLLRFECCAEIPLDQGNLVCTAHPVTTVDLKKSEYINDVWLLRCVVFTYESQKTMQCRVETIQYNNGILRILWISGSFHVRSYHLLRIGTKTEVPKFHRKLFSKIQNGMKVSVDRKTENLRLSIRRPQPAHNKIIPVFKEGIRMPYENHCDIRLLAVTSKMLSDLIFRD